MSPTIRNQATLAGLALAAGLALTAFSTGTALAASESQRDCEAAGGTYTKDGPVSQCVFPEKTKDVNGNAFGTTTQDTTTGQGTTKNKTEEECTGNQGQCKQ